MTTYTKNTFNQDLLAFLSEACSPFHAVLAMSKRLKVAGFVELDEADTWSLQSGQRYFLTRNDSSIIAFVYGSEDLVSAGIRMSGAHTDSPCLKVKPNPEINSQGYFQLGVETYGGVLLKTWFDRDLSLAGRVSYSTKAGELSSALIDFTSPIACIPSLAIHLDRKANEGNPVNAQKDIVPVLMQAEDKPDFRSLLKEQLQKEHGDLKVDQVLDYELGFYDTQKPSLIGLKSEFLASARLDNLLSCFVELQALIASDGVQSTLLVCNDHEEVGSASACGADGPMLQSFIQRLLPSIESYNRCIDRSMMLSVDNAHGIHPNFSDKHDNNHGPILNKGPVIKVNANQRYASNSETQALFRKLCQDQSVPVQSFVTRTDMACGSTIGPITASSLGVKTLDIGVPTFAMHSIRELAGSDDAYSLYLLLQAYNQLDKV